MQLKINHLESVIDDIFKYGRAYLEVVEGKLCWTPAYTIHKLGGKYKVTQPVTATKLYKYVQVLDGKIYTAFYDDEIIEITTR